MLLIYPGSGWRRLEVVVVVVLRVGMQRLYKVVAAAGPLLNLVSRQYVAKPAGSPYPVTAGH